jgi:serine phosphatase RsbU (regulator of sigma subunit)
MDGMNGRRVAWGVAGAALPPEPESGDRFVVHPHAGGVLIAAVDGMGHGAEAAAAATRATNTLSAFARESPISLVGRCHEGLKGTRGVVMTLAAVDLHEQTLTWIGVGNVDAMLFHGASPRATEPERILLRGGVVGYHLPALRAEVLPLSPLDTLIMTTDGIRPEFAEQVALDGDPQRIADLILARHRKGTDDALVVVARFLEGGAS